MLHPLTKLTLFCTLLLTLILSSQAAAPAQAQSDTIYLTGQFYMTKPQNIYVSGNYAYVVDGSTGSQVLKIINISNPEAPTLVSSYSTLKSLVDVYVSGNYAYVADGSSGLQIVDISDPTALTLVGNYDTLGSALGIHISGNYAFVADGSSGLQIINISNPATPTLVGSYKTLGSAWEVNVSGNYAYVVEGSSGLQIINISDPTMPTLAGSYDTPGTAFNVYVIGNYAYVADSTDIQDHNLQVIDISNPTTPSLVYSELTNITDIYVSGSYAYLTARDKWILPLNHYLYIVNISNPTSPIIKKYGMSTTGLPISVYVQSNYIYVIQENVGLKIFRFDGVQPATYSITGKVTDSGSMALAGVTLTTNSGQTATTDNQGNYTLSNLTAGSYTLTPGKTGYTFNPASLSVNLSSNVTGQNFVGTTNAANTYTVSGKVTDSSGAALAGVTLSTNLGQTSVTDNQGNYTLSNLAAGSYTFTPSKIGYTFNPELLSVTVPPNATGQNFVGTANSSANQLEVQIATPYQEVWHGEAIPITVTVKDNNALVSGASVTVGIGSYGKINFEEVVGSPGIYKGRLAIHGSAEMPPGNYTLEVQAESHLNGQTKIGNTTTSLTVSKATNVMEDLKLKVTCPAFSTQFQQKLDEISLAYVGLTCEITVNAVFPNNAVYNNAPVELDLLHANGSKIISLKPTGQNNSWSGSYQFTQAGQHTLNAHLTPPRETKILPTWKMGLVGVLISPNPIVGEWVSKPVSTVFKRYQMLKFQVKFTHDGQPATDKMLKAYLMRPGEEYELYPTDTPGVYDTTIQFNYSGDYELEVGIESSQYEHTYPAPMKFTISNEIEDGVKQTKELLQETRDLISELEKWQFKLAENGDKFEDELKKVSTGGERRTARILSKTLDTGVSCIWSEADAAWELIKFIYAGGETVAKSAEENKLDSDMVALLGAGAMQYFGNKYLGKEGITSTSGEYILDDMSQKGFEVFTERQLTLIGEAIDASRKQETAFLRNSYYQKYQKFNSAKLKLLTDIEFEAKFVEQWSTMSQATKEAWLEDIKLRREANKALKEMMVTDAKFIQHMKEAFEDSKDSFFDTVINVSKFVVPKLVKLYNPALGIAVDCGLKTFDATVALVDNSEAHRYELAIQTARSGIDGIDKTITQITMNSTSAVAGITLKEIPQIPDADITIGDDERIEGQEIGLVIPFKQSDPTIFAKRASVGIKIKNNSSVANDTQFLVMTKYKAIEEKRNFLWCTAWDSDTEVARGHLGEDAYLVKVAPRGSQEERFYFSDIEKRLYLQPSKGTQVRYYLFATNSKGVWLVGNEKKEFNPSSCPNPFGKQKQTTPITGTIQMVVPYPIVMSIREQDNSMSHLVTIEVYNPLPNSLAGTVSQIIPAGVTVSDKGSGNLQDNVISWVDNIPSKGWRTYQYTVTVSSDVTYSPATLKMYLPATDNYEEFDSNSEEVNPHVALIASSGLSSGKITSDVFRVPVTVTNLSSSSVSGHITVILKDNLGNHVITHTQIVSLPGNKVELINLDVDTTSLNKGSYNILGELNSNNKSSYFIMGKVEKIGVINTYLPLIIKQPQPPTPQPTSTPRPISTPTATATPFYFDDFSDSSSGWYVNTGNVYQTSYTNGEYEIRILNKEQWSGITAPQIINSSKYKMEVDIYSNIVGSSHGLISDWKDWSNFYVFLLNPKTKEFSFWKKVSNSWTPLVSPSYSSNINSGTAVNHLKIERNNSSISLYVNNQLLTTFSDATFLSGRTGLYVQSPPDTAPVSVRVDNFQLQSISNVSSLDVNKNTMLSDVESQIYEDTVAK